METNMKCPRCGSTKTKDHVYSREAGKSGGLNLLPIPMLARMAAKGAMSHEDGPQEYYVSWRCEDCRHGFLDPKSARKNMAEEIPMIIRGAVGVALFLLPALVLLVVAALNRFDPGCIGFAVLLTILSAVVAVPMIKALMRYRQNQAEAIEVEQAQQ